MYWLVWTLEQTINHTNLQGRFLKSWTQECPGNKENTVTTNQKSSNSIETRKLVQVFSFTRFRPEKKKIVEVIGSWFMNDQYFCCAGRDVLVGVANIEFSNECLWRCLRAVINLQGFMVKWVMGIWSWAGESSDVWRGENKPAFPGNDNRNIFLCQS